VALFCSWIELIQFIHRHWHLFIYSFIQIISVSGRFARAGEWPELIHSPAFILLFSIYSFIHLFNNPPGSPASRPGVRLSRINSFRHVYSALFHLCIYSFIHNIHKHSHLFIRINLFHLFNGIPFIHLFIYSHKLIRRIIYSFELIYSIYSIKCIYSFIHLIYV